MVDLNSKKSDLLNVSYKWIKTGIDYINYSIWSWHPSISTTGCIINWHFSLEIKVARLSGFLSLNKYYRLYTIDLISDHDINQANILLVELAMIDKNILEFLKKRTVYQHKVKKVKSKFLLGSDVNSHTLWNFSKTEWYLD